MQFQYIALQKSKRKKTPLQHFCQLFLWEAFGKKNRNSYNMSSNHFNLCCFQEMNLCLNIEHRWFIGMIILILPVCAHSRPSLPFLRSEQQMFIKMWEYDLRVSLFSTSVSDNFLNFFLCAMHFNIYWGKSWYW